MNKRWIIFSLALCCFITQLFADAPPVKLYIFAGQSNIDYRSSYPSIKTAFPDLEKWMSSDKNDILYSAWSGYPGKGRKSHNDTWSKFEFLKDKKRKKACIEHVIGYRLWKYWKDKNPKQRIAFLHVSKGGTNLYQIWNPIKKGPMFKALDTRLGEAKSKLAEMKLKYEIAGFFWWQGESDTWTKGAPDKYEELFSTLLNHVKTKMKVKDFPLVLVRINKKLPKSKRCPKGYPERLEKVRNVQMKIAESQTKGAWIDIDDVDQLKNNTNAHYPTENYIKVYQRMGDAYFKLLKK